MSSMFDGMVIPDWIFQTNLSNSAILVYSSLANATGPDGICSVGQKDIAAYLNTSVKTVERSIAELKKANLIEAEKTKGIAGGPNVYRFLEPSL